MKLIVNVVGDFTYINPQIADEVMYNHKPCLVTNTDFVQALLVGGKIDVLAKDLPENASQEEFDTFLTESKGDVELAVASFISKFDGAAEIEVKREDKKAAKEAEKAAKAAAKEVAEKEAAEKEAAEKAAKEAAKEAEKGSKNVENAGGKASAQ